MAYIKRDWDNTSDEVTKEDFKRIEEGIENLDVDLGSEPLTTDAQDVHRAINEHENQINVLNAEIGKKMSAVTLYLNNTSGDLLDTTISPLVLCTISSTNNASLYAILKDSFAYVITNFYSSMSSTSNRFQIAVGYGKDKMAFRRYNGAWGNWTELATTTMLQSALDALNA